MERVRYEAGNEHSPTDRLGRISVELDAGGTVRVEHHRWEGGQLAWTARVEPAFVDRLAAALREAGFPAAPMIPPSPGDRLRQLRVEGGPSGAVLLPWYEGAALPGYGEVFRLLDGLVTALGPDTGVPAAEPGPTEVRTA